MWWIRMFLHLQSTSMVCYLNSQITSHYLSSTITNNLLLELEIDHCLAKLSRRVWDKNWLTLCTKLKVFQACVLSTWLYSWTTYARQENHLESFHFCCLLCVFIITWRDKVINTPVLGQTDSWCVHFLLSISSLMSGSHTWN